MRAAMELIPILFTIILVATISTLILAVAAYIIYKIQGKKSDLFAGRKLESEKVVLAEPEDFGGRKLPIKKTQNIICL